MLVCLLGLVGSLKVSRTVYRVARVGRDAGSHEQGGLVIPVAE